MKEVGFDVIAVGHRPSDNGFFADYDIPYFSVDILDELSYSFLPQNDVFGIVHMAAILPVTMEGYNPRTSVESNMNGTLNVLDYAVKVCCKRFLFPKSWSDITYLTGSLKPIPADAPVKFPMDNDHTVYAITKNLLVI